MTAIVLSAPSMSRAGAQAANDVRFVEGDIAPSRPAGLWGDPGWRTLDAAAVPDGSPSPSDTSDPSDLSGLPQMAATTVNLRTVRRGVPFGPVPPDWSRLTGPAGTRSVGFAQTAALIGDPDVPVDGGVRIEARAVFRLGAATVPRGSALTVQSYRETHYPIVDYLPDGMARCTFLSTENPGWTYSFAGVEGDPGDLAVGMDKRVRIGFYPADAATGAGALITSAISGTVVMSDVGYDTSAAPCFEAAHRVATLTVVVPRTLPPGRYRVSLGSPALALNGISIIGKQHVVHPAAELHARVETSLPLLTVTG